jgi:hypothetical protein
VPRKPLMLPVVSLGAESLTMGYLMRRNILAYKAPPNNEGYDLICIHPNPRKALKQIRVQVKSRYQTDSNKAIFVKRGSLDAFDFLIAALLNIGHFYSKTGRPGGAKEPEFFTLPRGFVRKHLVRTKSGMDRVLLGKLDVSQYRNQRGLELIAHALGISYPRRKGRHGPP